MINLLSAFYNQVQNTPEKPAIVDQGGQRSTTYRELADMSERLAAWLVQQGIGREKLVAIRVPRGVTFIACRFAAMMAGAAWVGVEDMMGAERIAFILKDSGADLVIDEEAFREAMKQEPYPVEKWADPDPHDMAFLFYTSGSTGRAKGAVQEYGIYTYVMSSLRRAIDGYPFLTYANIAPETYIGGLQLMAGALCYGYTLHIIPLPLVRDPAGLLAYFKEHGIDGSCMPPTLVKALEYAGGLNLKLLHITGEITSDLFIDRFTMRNAYGPTEFSYLPFLFEMDKAYKNTPIGRPDQDTEIILLDEDGEKDPREGLMCIRLPYFRGYLHDEDRADFITVDGVTYFKSSDYMSVDENGNYTILGRVDDMVKINGNRIEPSEVEHAVKEVLGTDFAAVRAWERGGSRYLCAYHTTGQKLDAADMAEKLKEYLPQYMIPACYVSLDHIPLNENGKVNKKVLPRPDESVLFAPYTGPENAFQEKLCRIFAEVLRLDGHRIGIDDDFFLLGGSSLAAIELITAAGNEDLTVPMIYNLRTVRRIDQALRELPKAAEDEPCGKDFPLTDEQIYFLEHDLANPGRRIYNQPVMLSFLPDTEEERLAGAVRQVILAHPALLTVIQNTPDGWRQQIAAENTTRLLAKQIAEEDLTEAVQDFIRPFAFDGSPLFRTGLLRTPERLVFLMDVHHMICDGESLRIVLEDILAAYEGKSIPKDAWSSILHEKTSADNETKKKDITYFENTYRGRYDRLLSPDLAGGDHREGSTVHPFSFSAEEISEAAGRLHLSVNSFYLLASALSMMVYEHTQTTMLSWTFNGRSDLRAMRTVGLLIRDYPAAFSPDDEDTIAMMAASINRQIRKAILHGSVSPYMQRSKGELFCFLYQGDLLRMPECRQLVDVDFPEVPDKTAIEPLEFHLHEDEDGSWSEIVYDAGMYSPESMHRFAAIYESVCRLLLDKNSGALSVKDVLLKVRE